MPPLLTIPGVELAAIARSRYPFAYVRTLDTDYNVPTEDAFSRFTGALGSRQLSKFGDKWREFFDCDNFTFEAVALAQEWHFLARMRAEGNAQGVALGLLCFNVRPVDFTTGHCIAVRLNAARQLVEFEPQNRQPLPLTSDQCRSASLCLFF